MTEIIKEELTPKQKDKVDSWGGMLREHKEEHDRVFGKGNDKVVIPVPQKTEENRIHSGNINEIAKYDRLSHSWNVNKFLNNNGYQIHDYEAGLAYHKDTPNRKISIGKILGRLDDGKLRSGVRSKRSGELLTFKECYDADPIRRKAATHIVISRHRHDVAGMTAEDHDWAGMSCMNIRDGSNRHYLPAEVREGTIVAYATNEKNPTELKEPTGRLNIKNHTGLFTEHSTWIPETNHYGAMPPRVKNAIHDWVNTNYPKKNDIYTKNPHVYNDDGKTVNSSHFSALEVEPSERDKLVGKVSDHIQNAIAVHSDAVRERIDDEWAKYGYSESDHAGEVEHFADKMNSEFESKMDAPTKAHYAFHNAANALDKYDTYSQDHYRNLELNLPPGNSWGKLHDEQDVHFHVMAKGGAFDRHYLNGQAKHLDDSTLHKHLAEVHSRIESKDIDAAEYGWGEHAHAVYNALTNEVIRRHMVNPKKHQAAVDSIIHHRLDNPEVHEQIQKHHDYYDHSGERAQIPTWEDSKKHHSIGNFMHLTTDVPTFEKHIDHLTEHEYNGDFNSHDDSIPDSPPMEHYGKHSTHAFAEKIFGHEMVEHEHLDDFVKGLNQNPHGEQIQHHFTSQFHFPKENDDEFDPHADAFYHIAKNSTFPSVLNKLATRPDVSDEVKGLAKSQLEKLNA